MFEPTSNPRVFAVPIGCNFSDVVAQGVLQRMQNSAPEDMARITILVNSRRSARNLHTAFTRLNAGFLPKIMVIEDLAKIPSAAIIPQKPMPPLKRKLLLGQLVGKLLETDETLAPKSALFDLTDSLTAILDEMQREGLSPDCLQSISVDDQSDHWAKSLRFLSILSDYWTAEGQDPDPEHLLRSVIKALSAHWSNHPPEGPILLAGSTGSRGSTAALMKVVANLPQGAVILPGFDRDLPQSAWASLQDDHQSADHPQSAIAATLSRLDVTADSVSDWVHCQPVSNERNKLISLALRPAPITHEWMVEGPKMVGQLPEATQGITLLEAQSERHEANAIALIMRQAVFDNRKVALVTPDRNLTRRVHAALARWAIIPDDSAGRPLPLTPPGVFLRLVSACLGQPLTPPKLISILKHPLCFSGPERGRHMLRTRDLELQYLRGGPPTVSFDEISVWAAKRKADPEAVLWVKKLSDCFRPLENLQVCALQDWIETHKVAAEMLSGGFSETTGALWEEAAGVEAARIVDTLLQQAPSGGELERIEYDALFRSVLKDGDVRNSVTPHPNVAIWGTLEARVQWADIIILGGLNEGVWPAKPNPDPWLNRQMRKQIGLPLPETQIGLSAHDFQQMVAGPKVVLSRSIRDGEAPMVASRWVIRLLNLLTGLGEVGGKCVCDMRARGDIWTHLANRLDRPQDTQSKADRPRPTPPLASRPRSLRLTQLRHLIRDPYAIYAKYILDITPLKPLGRDPDALTRGIIVHKILEEFTTHVSANWPDNPIEDFFKIARDVLDDEAPWPAVREFWFARLDRIAAWHVTQEKMRQERGTVVAQECAATGSLQNVDFTLTAKADRIDCEHDGRLAIYDYKTGKPPTTNQVKFFDKQLPLEAALAQRGNFENLPAGSVARLEYIGLSGGGVIQNVPIDQETIDQVWAELEALILCYEDEAQPYTARQKMEKQNDTSDYDHLSRYAEWSGMGGED